jgi:dimethylhistidine N-methyltransferase
MDKLVVTNRPLLDAALEGLTARPKRMEPKWFYDEAGSALFEQITRLPEYYPTRTEVSILKAQMPRLTAAVPNGAELVELGSGASTKTRLLLDNLPGLAAYVPIDVSAEFLEWTAAQLRRDYPGLPIKPVAGDFTAPLALPETDAPRVAFFPGSTLGNLDAGAARNLLHGVRRWSGIAGFILGTDLVKDEGVLTRAYDDAEGVTARFNLNLLTRMNREIGADFRTDRFAHRAVWNAEDSRIEMHLVSREAQEVQIAGRPIAFAEGETIHTENSRKYTEAQLTDLARQTGWRIDSFLTDPDRYFAVSILTPA